MFALIIVKELFVNEDSNIAWYYVENGQQKGPLTQTEFVRSVGQGVVTAETLVWHSGMRAWEPYGKVAGNASEGTATEASCHYCGKFFARADLIDFNGTRVCAACKPLFVQQFKENAEVASSLTRRYAGFWIRAAANILDSILCNILTNLVSLPLFFSSTAAVSTKSAILPVMGTTYLLTFAISIAYYVIPLVKFGATPGKMACGLKVIRSDGFGLTYGRAIGRYFGNILSGITLGIGYLMVAFDKNEHKALHDIICDTRVIHKGN